LAEANLSAPQIRDILADLREEFESSFGSETPVGQDWFARASVVLDAYKAKLEEAAALRDRLIIAGPRGAQGASQAEEDAPGAAPLMDFIPPKKQVDEATEALDTMAKMMHGPLLNAFDALGRALVGGEDAFAIFAKGVLGSITQVLDALAQQMFVTALAQSALMGLGGPAASFAAAAAIKVASGIIKGMTAMAEGGIVTGPTNALIGEAGPEAVIPLSKMGGFGDTIIIMGDMLTQEEAYDRVTRYQQQRSRAY